MELIVFAFADAGLMKNILPLSLFIYLFIYLFNSRAQSDIIDFQI